MDPQSSDGQRGKDLSTHGVGGRSLVVFVRLGLSHSCLLSSGGVIEARPLRPLDGVPIITVMVLLMVVV
jgi:hypothetical protein